MILGGENTPIHDSNFEGVTPKKKTIATPNVVLGTPFRTPGQAFGSTPGRVMTPQVSGESAVSGATPARTPLRDQLSINADGAAEAFGEASRLQELELRAHLRTGLGSLPAPKNDFEIVLPEEDALTEADYVEESHPMVEDASEIEERNAKRRKEEGNRWYCVVRMCHMFSIHNATMCDLNIGSLLGSWWDWLTLTFTTAVTATSQSLRK